MKSYITIIITSLVTCLLALAEDHRLVVSPKLEKPLKENILANLKTYCTAHASTSEHFTWYNGASGAVVASFAFKEMKKDTERAREYNFREFERSVKRWIKETERSGERLQFVENFEHIASNNSPQTRCYVFGDPVYVNENFPEVSFKQRHEMRVPPRASLAQSHATQPFGCKGRSLKSGVSVFMIYPQKLNYQHELLMKSFYSDFFESQGCNPLGFFGMLDTDTINTLFKAKITPPKVITEVAARFSEKEDPAPIQSTIDPSRACSCYFKNCKATICLPRIEEHQLWTDFLWGIQLAQGKCFPC